MSSGRSTVLIPSSVAMAPILLAYARAVRHPVRALSTLLVIVALAAPAAAQPAAAPRPDWRGTGTVAAILPAPSDLHATRPVIVLKHESIPGLMEQSMYMPFIAASASLFEGLRPGDRVSFGLKETPDALLLISIEKRD